MFNMLRPALVLFALFTLMLGVAYPLAMTGVGQALFPNAANGSPIARGGKVVGSALIGQSFTGPDYFWGRPSAAGKGYDGRASAGSNLGPTSRALADRVKAGVARHGVPAPRIPVDLLTTSGSGLDPHISPAAARFQAARVAQARNTPVDGVLSLVEAHTEQPIAGIIGEPRVNVLKLNLALDALAPKSAPPFEAATK